MRCHQSEGPVIAASGVARLMLRRGLVAACSKHDRDLGLVMDIGMLVANMLTTADTRSWGTLPLSIDGARMMLKPVNMIFVWALMPTKTIICC